MQVRHADKRKPREGSAAGFSRGYRVRDGSVGE